MIWFARWWTILTNFIEVWRSGQTWAYRASAPDTNVGGGAINVEISLAGKGYEIEIDSITIGPDDYSGAEIVQVDLQDVDDNNIGRLANITQDNQVLSLPALGESPAANNEMAMIQGFTLSGTDKIFIQTGALAQNETLTVAIRARLRGGTKPTVTWSSSGTLGTVTIDYNEVI